MENKLSKEQLAEIERESELVFPDDIAKAYGKHDVITIVDAVHFQRQAYTAAASKYLLRVKDLEDGLRELYELKIYKDYNGKDDYYQAKQPKAWAKAERLLTK